MKPLQIGPFTKYNPRVPRRVLQPSELSLFYNAEVFNGTIRLFPGWSIGVGGLSTVGSPIIHMQEHKDVSGNSYLCVHTATKFYVWDGVNLTDITASGGYSASTVHWNSCSFGNLYIFTNGIDPVQSWNASTPMTNAINLTGAPKCKVIRAFASFVIAGNISDGTDTGSKLIKWCVSGNPISWSGGDSGSLYVYEAEGAITDIQPLVRDTIVVYKEESIHTLTYVGFPLYFVAVSMNVGTGVPSWKGVARVNNFHIALTNSGLVAWDGAVLTPFQPIIKPVIDKYFPNPNALLSVCFFDPNTNRLWVCIPGSSTYIENIFVYSFDTDSWSWLTDLSIRSLATASQSKVRIWDTLEGSWDGQTTSTWEGVISGLSDRVFLADASKVYLMDEVNPVSTRGGASFTAIVETMMFNPSMLIYELPFNKSELVQINISKSSGTLMIYVGTSEVGLGATDVTWHGPYVPNGDGKIYLTKVGRFFIYRVLSIASFELESITSYFVKRGEI